MKYMKAKFASKCHGTGAQIRKGDPIAYDPSIRRAYCKGAPQYKEGESDRESDDARMFRNMNEEAADRWYNEAHNGY